MISSLWLIPVRKIQALIYCFFSECDRPFDKLWLERVKQLSSEIPLSKSDISMLNDFGGQLGKTDTEGQLKHLELYEVSFSKQLSSALDAITKKSKLYKTMGFFAGSAIALMMI